MRGGTPVRFVLTLGMRSKIHMCQPETVPLIAFFLLDVVNQLVNGFWLARMNLATHSCRSNTVGF